MHTGAVAVSYMTLQPIPSDFPYILGKLTFLCINVFFKLKCAFQGALLVPLTMLML